MKLISYNECEMILGQDKSGDQIEIGDMIEIGDIKIIIEKSNAMTQFDQEQVKIVQSAGGERIFIGLDSDFYILDEDEDADADALTEYLAVYLSSYERDVEIISLVGWEIKEPEEFEVSQEFEGAVKILAVGCEYGARPVSFVQADGEAEYKTWIKYADAKNWIDKANSGISYLTHNQAARDEYYIVES
ncbi:MAG: hypothetical protein R8L53_10315 [Mariprofundales bacterium]